MKQIDNLTKAPLEIAQILGADERIQRFLTLDNDDPMNSTAFISSTPEDLINKKYIILFAPTEEAIEKIGVNSNICISVVNGVFSEDKEDNGLLYLFVLTNAQHIMLKNGRNRTLELVNIICQDLDNQKISSSITLSVNNFVTIDVGDYGLGYRISLDFQDQLNADEGVELNGEGE